MLEHYLPRASSFAGDIDQLVWIVTWIVGVWFVVVEAMFFWLMFRFRKKPGVPAQYITGKEKHLKNWINVPHNIILVLDVLLIVAAIRVWVLIKQTMPPADHTVKVMAQQWAWTFTDPGPDNQLDTADDIRTTDELHVEVGKTYHFTLESKDVVHSFFIPVFRLKQDAMPGRIYTGWFKPILPGKFDIACTQICGIGHGVMGAQIVVESAEKHLAWMQEHAGQGAALTFDPAPAPADTTAAPAAATN